MSQKASLLVHIGPLREESKTLLSQYHPAAALLAPLSPLGTARQKTLAEKLTDLHLAEMPVTPQGGEVGCYVYSLKDFNSLAPANELVSLYPGLGEARQTTIESQTLPQALQQAGLGETTLTHLVIEQPEIALDLLQTFNNAGQLDQLTHLWVRTSPLRLYQGMVTDAELSEWCQQHGFEIAAQHTEDPDFFLLGFNRNPLYSQLKAAQQQLEDNQAQLTKQQAQFKQLSEERDTLKNQLNKALKASQQHQQGQKETAEKLELANQQLKTTQQKLEAAEGNYQQAEKQRQEIEKAHQELQHKFEETHGWFLSRKQQAEEIAEKIATLQGELNTKEEQASNLEEKLKATEAEREKYNGYFAARKKQHEESQSQLTETQQALKERDVTISQLSEQLAALQQNNERFAQLEGKLEALFGEQKTYIQQTTNALGQHVTRSARQQRDEQALTHYLQHGQRPVSTQLPPGYAMALLEHYETTQHDVVVVLGSSETTELLAQAILNTRQQQPRLSGGQREQQDNEVTLSHADLPQAVVSIEHQKAASEALKQRLGNKALAQAVNVVYAPWVECQANGQSALFYAADATLQRLNQWLPDDARVLVIVGEALPDAGHSREVTLPVLLQQLPTQRLDIVLEGSSQPQETNLQENWNKLLESRQRPGHWLTLPNTLSLRVEG